MSFADAMPPRQRSLLELPDECLVVIFADPLVGLERVSTLCKRTCALWRRAVESIRWPCRWSRLAAAQQGEPELRRATAAWQAHFSHVASFSLQRADELQQALPSWYTVVHISSSLPQLRSLSIPVSDGYAALKALSSSRVVGGLHTRLQELALGDGHNLALPLGSAELRDLATLPGLTKLGLGCTCIAASDEDIATAAQQLSGLRSLELRVQDAEECHPSEQQLAALLTPLAQLTRLELRGMSGSEGTQLAALSGLVQLRALELDAPLPGAVQQQLVALQQLTSLAQCIGDAALDGREPIDTPALLLHLTNLQHLELLGPGRSAPPLTPEAAALLFRHPSLTSLSAGSLACGPEWRGVVLDGSQLRKLYLGALQPDGDPLASLPTFPRLECFHASHWARGRAAQQLPAQQRFIGVMQVVRRHSSSLKNLSIATLESFNEGFPPELPALESLRVDGLGPVGLATLGNCSLPRLTSLEMFASEELPERLHVEADLMWLARLPRLEYLDLCMGDAEELHEEFDQLVLPRLQGVRCAEYGGHCLDF
jgi:hypothetical protein